MSDRGSFMCLPWEKTEADRGASRNFMQIRNGFRFHSRFYVCEFFFEENAEMLFFRRKFVHFLARDQFVLRFFLF